MLVGITLEGDHPPLLAAFDRTEASRRASIAIDDRKPLALGKALCALEHREPAAVAERFDDETLEPSPARSLEDDSPRLDEGRVDDHEVLRREVLREIADAAMLDAIAMHHEHARRVARLRGLGRDPRRIERVVEIVAGESRRTVAHRLTRRTGR